MIKDKTILLSKIFLAILLIISVVGIVKNVSAGPNAGSEIVDIAKTYLNYPRADGYPKNKETELGGIFDEATVTAFDCSGLVSWAAGLRRHYSVGNGELLNFLAPGDWSAPQTGDILICFDHTHAMIFENLENSGTNGKVIQASSSAKEVTECINGVKSFQAVEKLLF